MLIRTTMETIFRADEVIAGTKILIADTDGDGANDGSDALPLDATETLDTDTDGIGNNADTDDDGMVLRIRLTHFLWMLMRL